MSDMVRTKFHGLVMTRQDQEKLTVMLAVDPNMCIQYIMVDEKGNKHYISECMGVTFVTRKLKMWRGTLTWRKHYHTKRDLEAAKAEAEKADANGNP